MGSRYAGGERFWVMVVMAQQPPQSQGQGGVVMGCVGLRVAAGETGGEIVRLTVADGWQRRGLGRRLIRHAEAHAKGRCGLTLLRATTLDDAALPGACAFYVSEGYALERRQAFGKGDGDLCHLIKRLP
jgi:GNAT superfamily N-acetyltransferase